MNFNMFLSSSRVNCVVLINLNLDAGYKTPLSNTPGVAREQTTHNDRFVYPVGGNDLTPQSDRIVINNYGSSVSTAMQRGKKGVVALKSLSL